MNAWEVAFMTCGIVSFACLPFIFALLVEKGMPDFVQGLADLFDWVEGDK